jgi:hypothetical protein
MSATLKLIIAMTIVCLLTNFTFAQEIQIIDSNRIDVLYFHATVRCQTCITIEEFTKNTLESEFKNELKNGTIAFKSFDFLDTLNEHFQDDYKFESQTLILSKKVNGKEVKWVNLEKMWDAVADYSKFKKYVVKEIKKITKN